MSDFEPVIGLEIHAQLSTRTKMFCGCPSAFGASPNTNVCPVCLGLPGALPVVNRTSVEYAVRAGLALDCTIAPQSVFARKNYFYPDCPKNYQITQYDRPLCTDGQLRLGENGKTIRIRRIHLEEDAGKLVHAEDGASCVDMNRCGVPLVEIVTEPDIRSSEDASLFARKLRSILRYLDVCDGNMEEGSLRCDVNVSVREKGVEAFGVSTEIKNLNSFGSIQRAIEFEIDRQQRAMGAGETIDHTTLLWDADSDRARVMRSKEVEKDYRYFSEPDLGPLHVSGDVIEAVRREIPELPDAKCARFVSEYGLPDYDAALLSENKALADFFDETAAGVDDPKTASNWIMGEVLRELNERKTDIASLSVTPEGLAELINNVAKGHITASTGKDVFKEMVETGAGADAIIESGGLEQICDERELDAIVVKVLEAHRAQAEGFLGGEEKLFKFLFGQVMKASGGKANPKSASDRLRRALDDRRPM